MDVKALSTDMKLIMDVNMPQRDRFFDKLYVEQFAETGSFTMSFMKMIDQDGTEKCVGVTSAHLLSKYRKPDNECELFVPLPQCLKNVKVEKVLLHPRILDDQENKKVGHADLMLVVLEGLPQIKNNQCDMKSLEVYPEESIPYNPAWMVMNISGRSQRDFVEGRSVAKLETEFGTYYEFMLSPGDKGDSGTLLFAIDRQAGKHFVGVYNGPTDGSRHRGCITPALGWKHLVARDVKVDNVDEKIKVIMKRKANGTEAPTMEEVTLSYTPNNANRTCVVETGHKEIFGTIIDVPPTMNSKFTDRDHSHDRFRRSTL